MSKQKLFLNRVAALVKYWRTVDLPVPAKDETLERMNGLAFSILNAIDEEFALIALTDGGGSLSEADISGSLHELWAKHEPKG